MRTEQQFKPEVDHVSLYNSNYSMVIQKALINEFELEVTDKPEWPMPHVGDKVEITGWDEQTHVQECVRVCKLPHVTVKTVTPVVVGLGNDRYSWAYTISIEESNLIFLQWNYKLLVCSN